MNRMITFFASDKLSLLLILLTILSSQEIKPQDLIDLYDGIPFIPYAFRWGPYLSDTNFVQLRDMGVFAVVSTDPLDSSTGDPVLASFVNNGIKVIPYQRWRAPNTILTYTDAHYTKWEVEGTNPSKGNATLEFNINATESFGQGRKTINAPINPGTILTWGPGYRQMVKYVTKVDSNEDPIPVLYYTAFRMKIVQISSLPPNWNQAVVCTLKVTATSIDGTSEIDVVPPKVLRGADFGGLGNWAEHQIVDLGYTLTNLSSDYLLENIGSSGKKTYDANHIQFKIIWAGLIYLSLYMDYIKTYDSYGYSIIETSDPKQYIHDQVVHYINNHSVIGWYGLDEPAGIDKYEPFRVVDSVVKATSTQNGFPIRLHTGFTAGYSGKYGLLPSGADTIFAPREFWLRAKPKNIQINCYNVYYPWRPDENPNYIIDDIDYVTNTYLNRINDFDTSFSFSVQTGAYYVYDTTCTRIDTFLNYPTTTQINYNTNLGLLYGARELRCDPFFSALVDSNCPNEFYAVGLIDENEETTENYNFFRNTINPRLNGWFGKTLKKLHQIEQFSNINAAHYPDNSTSWEFVDHIEAPGYPPSACIIDLGFFQNQLNTVEKYFMILNRYYSTLNNFNIGLRYLTGYNNWNVTDFIDTTNFTLVPTTGESEFNYDIYPGDARLFKVYPVVRDGGSLIEDETISNSETLRNDMTIENGANLTVNSTYDCYGNIYMKGNGHILTTNGGTIIFHNGKGIIAEGYPQILGTSAHKLILDFGSENEGAGIQILQNAQFIMNYCILRNAFNLISCSLQQFQTSISYCDFENSDGYAISLSGTSSRTPSINYCTFTNTDYGIFSAGQSSITIYDNTFTDNKIAISLSQIPNAQIISNTISSDLEAEPGILLSSCGGNIRMDSISGHTVSISLGNSSPIIGANTIFHNKINGIYVGPGSTPDLRGALVGRPPNQYPISGYNLIQENGGFCTGFCPSGDDGSEIYFSNSNMLLDYGCNYIADDRTVSPPLLTTLKLMNGGTTIERLYATYNAWGDTVYSGRFGNLSVVFSPYIDTICPLPVQGGAPLVIQDNDGNVIDTVYSIGTPSYSVSELDLSYAEASEDMINRNYAAADNIFNSIITSSPGDSLSQNAYLGLYKSKRLQNADSTALSQLRDLLNGNLPSISDSVMMKVVSQLSLLTLVDEKQYNDALNGFSDIVNQNPESDEAIFAEIDAMTTSLLAQNGNDSTLGKSMYKKYLVKGPKDMQLRMNELIKSRFGIEENKTTIGIIPTEYSLYNNYPNPFNPITTIRFDLPERTNVELSVYNILGQKVKSLISNETRNPGRYEVSFNGNSLASGVYIYKLTTQNYSQARKMLLIK